MWGNPKQNEMPSEAGNWHHLPPSMGVLLHYLLLNCVFLHSECLVLLHKLCAAALLVTCRSFRMHDKSKVPSTALFSSSTYSSTLSSVLMPRTATLFADDASCNQHSACQPAAAEQVDWPSMWHATHLKDGRAVSDQVAFPVVTHGAA
jgi:hypothetical protein